MNSISQYIYEVFTKPRFELTIGDIATGVGVILGGALAFGGVCFLIAWLGGCFENKKKQDQEKDKGDKTDV